ncbi:MAG: hypothetical protein ABIK90_00920 [candidate division WOR-3 bacterium]
MCCDYINECRENCHFNTHNFESCGLRCFLNTINEERRKCPEEINLINELEEVYRNAWNAHIHSRARGRATGAAFERWIREQIGNPPGVEVQSGGIVQFSVFRFPADILITTSSSNQMVILEVKYILDRQQALFIGGLLYFLEENMKLGIVTFARPREDCINILEHFKKHFKNEKPERFDYFFIQSDEKGKNGWSTSIKRLKSFCNLA